MSFDLSYIKTCIIICVSGLLRIEELNVRFLKEKERMKEDREKDKVREKEEREREKEIEKLAFNKQVTAIIEFK